MAESRTKDGPIAWSDSGVGEPVLLIHCSSASGGEWDNLRATLDRAFRTIAPDQWGCGDSDPWTGRGRFGLAREAAPILDIVHRIGAPVHLVGHSYGGGVALHVAREHSALIRSLTLIEPSVFHLLRDGDAHDRTLFDEISGIADAAREAIASGDYRGGMARFVGYWNGEGAWDALSERARARLARNLSKVVLDFRALFDEPARLADYAALTVPTLLVCGDRSPAPSRRLVEMLAAAMRETRTVRLQGAGHMSPFTHPDAVSAAVRAQLDRHRGDAARLAA